MTDETETVQPVDNPVSQEIENQEVNSTNQDAEQPQAESEQNEAPKPRGVQKRIDELTANWRNTERDRDHWRELAMQKMQQPQPQPQPQEYYPQYDENGYPLIDVDYQPQDNQPAINPAEIAQQVRQQLALEQQQAQFGAKVQEFVSKINNPDTLEFIRSPASTISVEMAEAAFRDPNGSKIADYLALNQSEAARIANLPPHLQGYEMALLSHKVSSPAKPTNAPPPIRGINGNSSAMSADLNSMPIDQFMALRNKK